MPWERSDKKRYSGKIEGIFVSITEAWDVEDFIDQYLVLRGFQVNDMNRDRIALRLEAVPGRSPYRAAQLVAWLDENFTASAPRSTERSESDVRTPPGQLASKSTTAGSDCGLVQPSRVGDFDASPARAKLNQVEVPVPSSAETSVTPEIYKPFGDGQRVTGTTESPQFSHRQGKNHGDAV